MCFFNAIKMRKEWKKYEYYETILKHPSHAFTSW